MNDSIIYKKLLNLLNYEKFLFTIILVFTMTLGYCKDLISLGTINVLQTDLTHNDKSVTLNVFYDKGVGHCIYFLSDVSANTFIYRRKDKVRSILNETLEKVCQWDSIAKINNITTTVDKEIGHYNKLNSDQIFGIWYSKSNYECWNCSFCLTWHYHGEIDDDEKSIISIKIINSSYSSQNLNIEYKMSIDNLKEMIKLIDQNYIEQAIQRHNTSESKIDELFK